MFEFSVRSCGQSVKAGVVAAGNAPPHPLPDNPASPPQFPQAKSPSVLLHSSFQC